MQNLQHRHFPEALINKVSPFVHLTILPKSEIEIPNSEISISEIEIPKLRSLLERLKKTISSEKSEIE